MSHLGQFLTAGNLGVAIPPGWDVRIRGAAAGRAGAVDYPVLHAANFALPAQREDFGGELPFAMTDRHVFVALLGHGSNGAGQGLFAPVGIPGPLDPEAFGQAQMQRPVPGRAGVQRFFTAQGRKFCLYSVVGSYSKRTLLVPLVNQFLASLSIQPAAAASPGNP